MTRSTPVPDPLAPARAGLARRALTGAAWTLAWTLVWASALLMFAHRAHAAPPTLAMAIAPSPVSLPVDSR
jgi:hypothetical protein